MQAGAGGGPHQAVAQGHSHLPVLLQPPSLSPMHTKGRGDSRSHYRGGAGLATGRLTPSITCQLCSGHRPQGQCWSLWRPALDSGVRGLWAWPPFESERGFCPCLSIHPESTSLCPTPSVASPNSPGRSRNVLGPSSHAAAGLGAAQAPTPGPCSPFAQPVSSQALWPTCCRIRHTGGPPAPPYSLTPFPVRDPRPARGA